MVPGQILAGEGIVLQSLEQIGAKYAKHVGLLLPGDGTAMASIIAIGEILLELFPKSLHAPLDTATDFERYAGGAPLTFAATAQRLGCAAGLICVVGTDPFSGFLVEDMRSGGVSTDLLRQVAEERLPHQRE